MSTSLLRQLKIDLITDTPNLIMIWFNSIWDKVSVVEIEVYHDKGGELVYYLEDSREWLFYQDKKNNCFWCNYYHYWSVLKDKFGIYAHSEIHYITKYLIENKLNDNISNPTYLSKYDSIVIENALLKIN